MKKHLINVAFVVCVVLMAYLNSYATDYTRLMDFDGDGKTDVGVFDAHLIAYPFSATYFRYKSSINGEIVVIPWGRTFDSPVPADYDGDGLADAAIFRSWDDSGLPPFNVNQWWINGTLSGYYVRFFGTIEYESDRIPGDYDDDGKAEPAQSHTECDNGGTPIDPTDDFCQYLYSYQLPDGEFFVSQVLGWYTYYESVGGGLPAPGDYDGDGATNIAIFDPQAQKFRVFLPPYTTSAENIYKEQTMDIDLPAPGDFNGDGRTDFSGVKNFQTETVTSMIWKWKYNLRTGYEASGEVTFGMSNEFPVPGDYDGDGITDIAVYNKSTATFKIRLSGSNNSTVEVQLGNSYDIPTTLPVQNPHYFVPNP